MADLPNEAGFVDPPPFTTGEAARVGAGLKEVRERLGWKLPDVAAQIRIRAAFLTAIEEGDLSSLPGAAYRVGFVRSYAQTLGLDDEEILQRFRSAGQIEETPKEELKLLVPVPDRGMPKGAVVLIVLILIICGYGLWYHYTEQTVKTAQNIVQVPARLQPLAVPAKVTPTITPTPSTTPLTPSTDDSNVKVATASQPSTSTTAEPTAMPNGGSTPPLNASTAQSATNPQSTPANPASQKSASTTSTQASVASASPSGLAITATQPSWVQVTAPNGTILFSKVLDAGESWPVPQMPGLKLTTGNAGGTVVSNNGSAGQPLGANGVVLHDYQLTPPAPGSSAPQASSTDATNSTKTSPNTSNASTAAP